MTVYASGTYKVTCPKVGAIPSPWGNDSYFIAEYADGVWTVKEGVGEALGSGWKPGFYTRNNLPYIYSQFCFTPIETSPGLWVEEVGDGP